MNKSLSPYNQLRNIIKLQNLKIREYEMEMVECSKDLERIKALIEGWFTQLPQEFIEALEPVLLGYVQRNTPKSTKKKHTKLAEKVY